MRIKSAIELEIEANNLADELAPNGTEFERILIRLSYIRGYNSLCMQLTLEKMEAVS